MTQNGKHEVVSVAAGTRCISGKKISFRGEVINDMHAEILARRCLISYFYDQLDRFCRNKKSIFVSSGKRIKLKNGISFHLYINTPPCGDASINAAKKGRGVLRAKVEAIEGTHPTKDLNFTVQTLKGKLRTMSCSDKICRWNVLGLQGALLSTLIEPIYLRSVIIGNVMQESHLQRYY